LRLRRTIVVTEKAADALPPPDGAAGMGSSIVDQVVAEALMVAFAMIMDHELGERTTKVPFPERNHAVQALFLYRPNKPLRVRIAVGCAERCPDHAHTGRLEQVPTVRPSEIESVQGDGLLRNCPRIGSY
jgi:hypothetical protein